MGVIAVQLDKLKKAKSLGNSSDIARLLGVHRQTVSAWRKGDSYPEEDRIAQMAELAGEDPGIWLASVRAERSEGRAAATWHDVARRLAAAAAVVLMVAAAGAPQTVEASGFSASSVYYVTALAMAAAAMAHHVTFRRRRRPWILPDGSAA